LRATKEGEEARREGSFFKGIFWPAMLLFRFRGSLNHGRRGRVLRKSEEKGNSASVEAWIDRLYD